LPKSDKKDKKIQDEREEKARKLSDGSEQQYPELSDTYYEGLVDRFFQEHNINFIERNWVRQLAKRYAISMRQSNLIDVDLEKLI